MSLFIIIVRQTLSQTFHAVSIKLLDFFRSFSLQFFNLFQALSNMVDRNWVIFTHWDFSLYIWISFNRNLIKIMPFEVRIFIIDYFVIIDLLLIFAYTVIILYLFKPIFRSWIDTDEYKKIHLEDWSCLLFFYILISNVNSPDWSSGESNQNSTIGITDSVHSTDEQCCGTVTIF